MTDGTADLAVHRSRLHDRLGAQASTAAQLGSPLYAHLLAGVQADVADGGPCWAVLSHVAHEPDGAAVPLRFMAAVHRLVLRRQAPALAVHYPSVGGAAGLDGAWEAFRDTVAAHHEAMVDLVRAPCQTNEVGRSNALGAGLAWLAGRARLPLRHLEIGTSAGLNLRWDRFAYGSPDGTVAWGPRDSPVQLTGEWLIPPPDLPAAVEIAERAGCDPDLLDPSSAEDRETLTAAVWADMTERHERLEGALAIAADVPADTVRAGAGQWLADRLAEPVASVITVVAHSVVWRYIPVDEREAIQQILADAGVRASRDAPLVWLRLEPRPPAMTYDGTPYPLLATMWPGGETVELARALAHGQQLRWIHDRGTRRSGRISPAG